jgi:hypothetical protein
MVTGAYKYVNMDIEKKTGVQSNYKISRKESCHLWNTIFIFSIFYKIQFEPEKPKVT